MNIKGLLLGSAAALVAVSGARAADAVVIAEPEPFEYVRICDTYGAGFYYIPGTETCLKFSGYMRYDIGIGALGHEDVIDRSDSVLFDDDEELLDAEDRVVDTNDAYYKRARFSMRVDARQETELGTLRAYAELRFNYSTTTVDVIDDSATPNVLVGELTTTNYSWDLNHGYIELGGFRVGKTDSLFTTFTGYAGPVINDTLVEYGPFGTHQIAYTFTGGNGFSAAVALEAGDGPAYTVDSYVPHIVGGVGYTAGWGGISAVVGYDSVWEEWAGKVRADFNATDAISLFLMGGWKSDDVNPNFYGNWGGDWAVWGGGSWKFNDKATGNLSISYDDAENFGVAANVAYELVNNFVITPEVTYSENFDVDDSDEWGGFLRFQMNWGS